MAFPFIIPRRRLYRIGFEDALDLYQQGYQLMKSESDKSWEMVSPEGYAEYWITRDCYDRLQRCVK